jgi:hypothetical protein
MLGDANMTHLKPAEWKKRVRKEVGMVPNEVWAVVIEKGFVDIANKEEEIEKGAGLGYLLERVNDELISYYKYTARPTLPKPQKIMEETARQLPPDKRSQALSRIVIALFNNRNDIQSFRKEVLNGQLLKPEEVPTWVLAMQKKDGNPVNITLKITANEDNWVEEIVKQAQRVAASLKDSRPPLYWARSGVSFGREYEAQLSYIEQGSGRETVPIKKGGILERLKNLSKELEAFWPESLAVQLILTGISPPPINQARAGWKVNAYKISNKITLEVSPHLSGDRIKELYLEEKKQFLKFFSKISGKEKRKSRRLTEKHLTLAVFAVEQPGSWAMKLRKWNKEYPHWAYPNTARSTFARDCRAAYERLTGWKWNG